MGTVHTKLATVIASLAFLSFGVAVATPAAAAPLIFDRGLPTADLNNAAGASRSNVAWADNVASTVSIGDNFTLSGSSIVDTIRVWVVGGPSPSTLPSANAYQLWLGTDTGVAATTTVTQIASSTSVSQKAYSDSSTYQASSGTFRDIYEVDFSGLNLLLAGGTYAFSVSGLVGGAGLTTPYLHASNAALSGSTQMGPDGLVYGFTAAGAMDTGNGYPFDSSVVGWDKSSDVNVQVFGTQVPEPASLAILGLGIAGFGFMRRRRAV